MKRLTFEQEGREPRAMERVRQGFLNRMKDVAIVGAALFTLGGCAGGMASSAPGSVPNMRGASAAEPRGMSMPTPNFSVALTKDAVSPTADSVVIGGRTLNVVRLDTSLANLDRQTARYREPETIPTDTGGRYMNSVWVPNEVRFLVTIFPNEGTRMLDVQFPRERDPNPSGGRTPGLGSINLTEFSNYVRSVSGQEMVRVNFVVETGTFENNGVTTNFTNAHIFPLNAQGEPITRRGNGEYIIYAASYYANRAGGSASLLVEPGNRDSLYAQR